MSIHQLEKPGMLTEAAAYKICKYYKLAKPWIEPEEQEVWLTCQTFESLVNDTFPYKKNRDSKGNIILNLWLIIQIAKDNPDLLKED